jgi:hypothetical protein
MSGSSSVISHERSVVRHRRLDRECNGLGARYSYILRGDSLGIDANRPVVGGIDRFCHVLPHRVVSQRFDRLGDGWHDPGYVTPT